MTLRLMPTLTNDEPASSLTIGMIPHENNESANKLPKTGKKRISAYVKGVVLFEIVYHGFKHCRDSI